MSFKLIVCSFLLTIFYCEARSADPAAIYLERFLGLAAQFGDDFEDQLNEIKAIRLSEDELYRGFPDIPILLTLATWKIHHPLLLAATINIKNREIWRWYGSDYDVELMTFRDGRTDLFYFIEWHETNITAPSQSVVEETFALLNLDLHKTNLAYYLPIQRTDIKHAETLLSKHYPQIRQVFKSKLDELKLKGLKKMTYDDYTNVSEEMDNLWQKVFASVFESVLESIKKVFKIQE